MTLEFGPKKVIDSTNIDVGIGCFAIDKSPIYFETCRERFAAHFKQNSPGFFLKHGCNQGDNIAHFILKTEKILKRKEFSKFAKTNRRTIIWIEPSRFWMECEVRRSLFTVLVRTGMIYDIKADNYEQVLFASTGHHNPNYAFYTQKAVMRFLFGFTKYTGTSLGTGESIIARGWRQVFEKKGEEEIKKLLVWPDESSYNPSIELEKSLCF